MGKIIRQGTKGYAVNFVTRNNALKKLQITLPEFRKLCILKGVYPKNPRKKVKGKDKTYYYKKDIIHLMHDPLIQKFRDHRVWKKKVLKAKVKSEKKKLETLRENKPVYSLNHLVKERYPTFIDAIRDLDDALCLIFLFANVASTKKIHQWRIDKCQKLCLEFQYYVMKTNSLRKVFLSIKGIYYQAEIFGETITWIVPYKFTQKTSKRVDYTVMLSFLEFYEVFLSFVNYKLFHSLGEKYPPVYDSIKFSNGEYLSAMKSVSFNEEKNDQPTVEELKQDIQTEVNKTNDFELKKKTKDRAKTLSSVLKDVDLEEKTNDKEETVKEKTTNEDEALDDFGDNQTKKLIVDQNVNNGLFKDCVFWVSRECPKDSLEFVIKSFGGKITWEGEGSSKNEEDESITHHIVDRGTVPKNKIISRDYIQPQYVYDCINAKVLLPVDKYEPGCKLPPHLSPFVDYEKEGYTPEYKTELDYYFKKANGIEVENFKSKENGEENEEEESDDDKDEERYERELKAEKEGNYSNQEKSKKRKRTENTKQKEEEEQAKTAVSLLSRKRRRLLQRIDYSQKRKQGEVDKKEVKKNLLDKDEAFVNEEGIIVYKQQKED